MAAAASGNSICVRLEHDVVRIAAGGAVSGDMLSLLSADCTALTIAADAALADCDRPLQEYQADSANPPPVAPVDSDALEFLRKLSLLTTVPSSDASRANAGAVGSDND